MYTREEHQQDIADQRALFDKVARLFNDRRAIDPTIVAFAWLPFTLVLRRNGYLLLFQQGSGRAIGFGQIRWHPKWPFDLAAVRSAQLRVTRSQNLSTMFQLDDGPASDLDSIARDIVDTCLRRTAKPQAGGDDQFRTDAVASTRTGFCTSRSNGPM